MLTTSVSANIPAILLRAKLGARWRQGSGFLFSPDSIEWLTILRIGLGLEIALYALSLRADWARIFASSSTGFLNREFTEAVLSSQKALVPRIGWLIWLGERVGLSEQTTLATLWLLLFAVGCFLVAGLYCRSAALVAWLLHLSAAKSGEYLAYGMDNFLTIGLFYLMIAPLPDGLALDRKLWRVRPRDPEVVGFFRRVLQLHLCVIYFFGGITKCLGAGWWTGDSMWRALTRPPFDLIANQTLIHWKPVLLVLVIAVCLLELTFPILIWPKKTRLFCLSAIIGMHIGIGVTMGIHLFSLVMIVLDLAAVGRGLLRRYPTTEMTPKVAKCDS